MKDFFRVFVQCSFRSYLKEYTTINENYILVPMRFIWIHHELRKIPIVYSLSHEEKSWLQILEISERDYELMEIPPQDVNECVDSFKSHMEIFKLMDDSHLGWICYDEIIKVAIESIVAYGEYILKSYTNSHALKKCVIFIDKIILSWVCSVFHKDCEFLFEAGGWQEGIMSSS